MEPIFIVGTSRSGTTLLKEIFNKHPDVCIVEETHYFDDLREKVGPGVLSIKKRKIVEDYLLGLTHKVYRSDNKADPEQGWMNRLQLRDCANQKGGAADNYFEAFCELWACEKGKKIWGEKTPRHIFQIETILALYPKSHVICMLRHPAAVISSYRDFWKSGWQRKNTAEEKRLRASYHPIMIGLLWKAAYNSAKKNELIFPDNVVTLKFEDLIADPEPTLKRLTSWIGFELVPQMLDICQVNSSYSKNWQQVGDTFSVNSVNRWKTELSMNEIAIIQSACGDVLAKAGYSHMDVHAPLAVSKAWLTLPLSVIKGVTYNRQRIGNLFNYLWKRTRQL